jgi:osmotically-inducible protein OsmY
MSLDADIERAVEEELRSDPDIESADIVVSVNAGRVTLAGFVCSYTQRAEAERDARRVAGVSGVGNDIEVRLPLTDQRPDGDIVGDAVLALKAELPYSSENIQVLVAEGRMTLAGTVEWNYARAHAENAVKRLRGVTSVINSIEVKPKTTVQEVRCRIESSAGRSLPVWIGG